jgi:hypothetical protein
MATNNLQLKYTSLVREYPPELSFLSNREGMTDLAERMSLAAQDVRAFSDAMYNALPPYLRHIHKRKAKMMIRRLEREGLISFDQ